MIVSKSIKWLVGILIGFTAISIVTVVYVTANHSDRDEDEEEAVKAPSHVSMQNGATVITLNAATQEREGIRVQPVTESSRRAELRATSVILSVSSLAALRNTYIAARTKLERDRVDLATSRSQYQRTKTLYAENQNMSLQAMQSAEATYRNNQAQVTTDEQDANLQLDTIRQSWGSVVEKWVSHDGSTLNALLDQREFLAQVVFPLGEVAIAPTTLSITAPTNQATEARLVSPMPQVNAQIQGISYLYLIPSRPGFAVGMNLTVLVPVGTPVRGVTIPGSAVVWWQGKAWLYEAISPTTFTRREVTTENPVTGGYFVPGSTFTSGTKVVTAGAQALLSEEFRSQIQQES
jgi:hypothetical protein